MRIPFTKMQGAGNDFVVLDETRTQYGLRPEHYRFLGNRHFGVGADQILTVRNATQPEADFAYVIHNADGSEVEHCGNGARCFVRFVHEQGLSTKRRITVQVQRGLASLELLDSGDVLVAMDEPQFAPESLPFVPGNTPQQTQHQMAVWQLALPNQSVNAALVSMGNPHAVVVVNDASTAPVGEQGRAVQMLPQFPKSVNVGFMQIVSRHHIKLRVYERGAGETLACGTGACAAVVAGIRMGLLDSQVQVDALGGTLHIGWQGTGHPVMMSGPAVTVFKGEIEIPDVVPEHALAKECV